MKKIIKQKTALQVSSECLIEQVATVPKPKVLQAPKEWLRAKEVVDNFPIGLSTLYYWRDNGTIKQWKNVSKRVTVYSLAELQALFSPNTGSAKDSTTTEKVKRKKKKPLDAPQPIPTMVNKKSNDNLTANFASKRKEAELERAYSRPMRKKLPPAKEGILGASRREASNKKISKGKKYV